MKKFLSLIFGTFIFGPIVVVIFTMLLFFAALRIDALYEVSLFIPRQIGLVKTVEPEDIIDIRNSELDNVFLKEGRYRIYSNQLIVLTSDITILDLESNRFIHATSIPDANPGLNEDGEPQFIFMIENASTYRIRANELNNGTTNQINFEIVPYFGNQNSAIALFGGFIQIGLLWLLGKLIYQYMNKDKIAVEKARQKQTREEIGSFLDEIKRK